MASLQDQLLKAGIIDKSKNQKAKKEKHKQQKQLPKGQVQEDEAKILAAKARAEKLEKDRQINQKNQQEAERRAILAQIKQLVATSRLSREGAEQPYQFAHDKKIKKIYVTDEQQRRLVAGQLAIVVLNDQYELVPPKVAEKIAQRDEAYVVVMNQLDSNPVDVDDPYADYQIPDDLMW
ncbi:MAG: nucleoprotein/polynucleotide-associated enzyme [Pseudomonadales bacterium]|nr:nucleoprotein/polynucleotide-associated enzyme [Pseudomonadales bacterium]RLU01436.1 MAG: DUF2058 domain-containing protein [Ketobacter sp.]